MRDVLGPGLASGNPKAYQAHFRNLDLDAQRTYLGGLTREDLRLHFRTMGDTPTVGLFLTTLGTPKLEATVGGSSLGEAQGPAIEALQGRAIELGLDLGAKVVSGMLTGALAELPTLEATLKRMGWTPTTIILAGDEGIDEYKPSLGWAIRGSIGAQGTFYMPTEQLRWDARAGVEANIRDLAARWSAQLDVRLG